MSFMAKLDECLIRLTMSQTLLILKIATVAIGHISQLISCDLGTAGHNRNRFNPFLDGPYETVLLSIQISRCQRELPLI
jgi:hypothetical protein